MKKIMLFIFSFIILSLVANHICTNRNDNYFNLVLKQTLATTTWERYEYPDFHYVFYYPSFFTREDAEGNGVGYALFSYHGHDMNIGIECMVSPRCELDNTKNNSIYSQSFNEIDGYTQRTHYIKQGKLWYSLSFYYPDAYKDSVQRLLYMVDNWKVWDSEKRPDFRKHKTLKNNAA